MKNKNIMIIDDHKEMLSLIREILELNEYTVFTFDYFKVALKFFEVRHHEISLVLLDMHLPDATPVESIPALFAINPHVALIGMSGGPILSTFKPDYKKHLRAFLQKPFEVGNLLSEINLCYA